MEEIEQLADALPKGIDRALLGFAQMGFEFGDRLLDWVEIGRIGRQVAQLGPGTLDDLLATSEEMRKLWRDEFNGNRLIEFDSEWL